MARSRRGWRGMLFLLAACGLLAPPAFAGGKRDNTRITGLVHAARSAQGKITAVTLAADRGADYHVVLDEKGRALGESMAGEKTQVRGRVATRDGQPWITVQRFIGPEMAAAHEQWRRMRCNYCVVAPALVNATVPKNLRGAAAVDGRAYAYASRIVAWTRDDRFLWAATDNALLQIDLDEKRLVRSYDARHGLPDHPIYELRSDGEIVWMVYRHTAERGGVAALAVGGRRVIDLAGLRNAFACLLPAAQGVWVIADTGTFRVESPAKISRTAPAVPTAERIRKHVGRGIWLPFWARKTRHLLYGPAAAGDRIYVGSYGDLYELRDGAWRRLARNAWNPTAWQDRLWFLSSQGVCEYDPETEERVVHSPPAVPTGRCRLLAPTDDAVWVGVEPISKPDGTQGGGIGRLDLETRKWQTWSEIGGHKTEHAPCVAPTDDGLWLLSVEGKYESKPAHPGMTYVKKRIFVASGFCLHRYRRKDGTWNSVPVPMPTFEKRLILGQDGARGHDVLVPQAVTALSAGRRRLFAVTRLFPKKYFCGYYPSIEQLAARDSLTDEWQARSRHQPEELGLQGQHPLLLNISNTGRMVLKGVGHDSVLGLFHRKDRHWAVTEGCVGWFDPRAGRWRPILELGFRFYWRATAALEDGDWLYVGSDRGLISRLNRKTGRFEFLIALEQRSISRIAKDDAGNIVVGSDPSPLGVLPVQLRRGLRTESWPAARYDGETWVEASPKTIPRRGRQPWFVRRVNKRHRWDKSRGNYLWGPTGGKPEPQLYIKGVFYPRFLCAGEDARLWISTHTGLLRVERPKPAAGAGAATEKEDG
ncbi:MAG: hypothetical protein R6V58_03755 [Planctomycetota bacterium]